MIFYYILGNFSITIALPVWPSRLILMCSVPSPRQIMRGGAPPASSGVGAGRSGGPRPSSARAAL